MSIFERMVKMAKFEKNDKITLKANVEEGWLEELGVVAEVENQEKYPGMYIVQVAETKDDDGIREVDESNITKGDLE